MKYVFYTGKGKKATLRVDKKSYTKFTLHLMDSQKTVNGSTGLDLIQDMFDFIDLGRKTPCFSWGI